MPATLLDVYVLFYLTDHHTLGVKAGHSHQTLNSARLVTLAEKNGTVARRLMSIAGSAHLRVARYFIKNMRPFSHCEDASYREQASRYLPRHNVRDICLYSWRSVVVCIHIYSLLLYNLA